MNQEEKFKQPTQWIWNKSGRGRREVLAENKFRYIFNTDKTGKCVCLVRTDNHRKWFYQFDWMVPYFPEGAPPVTQQPDFEDPGVFTEETNAHLLSDNNKKVIELKPSKTKNEEIKDLFKINKKS